MLKDTVKVRFAAGRGGNGVAKFAAGTKRYPLGGDGGNGGDVYLLGSHDVYDLGFINADEEFKADDGQVGGGNKKRGADGKDLVFKVPLVTEVYDEEGNLVVAIRKKGQKHLLLKGGRGGLGNYVFRSGQAATYDKCTPGKPGEKLNANLILKLVADVVFIGLPNAGKSSMLNELTNANVKVGNYAFTTLSPHLGSLPGITFMDLPGLIEGTAQGKGLGSGFIKHTENAKLVAHFLSLESEKILEDYQVIHNELASISEDLAKKEEIIILTKSDIFDTKDALEAKVNTVKTLGKKIIVCSIIDDASVSALEETLRKEVEQIKRTEDTDTLE